ncbi:hypothetical protein BaRGS_00008917, partial [Batillaria attramentaria]
MFNVYANEYVYWSSGLKVPDKGRESRGLVVMDRAADVSVSHPDVIRLSRYLQTCPRCMVRWDSMALCPLNHVGLEMTTWLQELRELLSMGCKMSYIGGACTADKSRCCVGEDETVLDHLLDLNVRIREVYRVLQTSCDRCPGMYSSRKWIVDGAIGQTGARARSGVEPATDKEHVHPITHRPAMVGKTAREEADSRTPVSNHAVWTAAGEHGAPGAGAGSRVAWDCKSVGAGATRLLQTAAESLVPGLRFRRNSIDGVWGTWGPWSTCPVSCGEGLVVRRRVCDIPVRRGCGIPCSGSAIETTRSRNLRKALSCFWRHTVNGNWGPWEPWGACSVTCGCGEQLRRRRCDNPPANLCGQPCLGPLSETRICNRTVGPGGWGSWGPWSACTVTCGEGVVQRERTCDSPPPDPECGSPCTGPSTERIRTRCGPDIEWTRWSRWSSCSATCPPARRRRTRQCLTTDNQYRQDCYCPGRQDEDEECRLDPCTGWTEWGAWCPCDCRKGIRSRRRSCEIVLPPDRIGKTVPVHMCRDHTRTGTRGSSEAREEEFCDVAREKSCPKCITSCYGKTDGAYPSCSSCSSYYNCTDGRGSPLFCRPGNEWDAFKSSCQPGLSPSCNPRNILRDVQG